MTSPYRSLPVSSQHEHRNHTLYDNRSRTQPSPSSTPPSYTPQQLRARELYFAGLSLRQIAADVLPGHSGGHITVHRWARRFGWESQREALILAQAESDKQQYLGMIAEVKDHQLRIAHKALLACELALDAYFEKDESGIIVGIIRNPRSGMPVIGAMAMASLLGAATTIQQQVLGMQQLAPEDTQATTLAAESGTRVVDALPPERVKQLADYLATLEDEDEHLEVMSSAGAPSAYNTQPPPATPPLPPGE